MVCEAARVPHALPPPTTPLTSPSPPSTPLSLSPSPLRTLTRILPTSPTRTLPRILPTSPAGGARGHHLLARFLCFRADEVVAASLPSTGFFALASSLLTSITRLR